VSVYKFYIEGDSVFHRLNPLVKFIWLATFLVETTIVNELLLSVAVLAWALVCLGFSKIPLRKLWPAFAFSVWLGFLSVLLMPLFYNPGKVIFELDVLRYTDIGLNFAMAIGVRAAAMLAATMILFSTTTQAKIIDGLTDTRMPAPMVFGVALSIRYVPVLLGELQRVKEAQISRAFSIRRGSLARRMSAISESFQSLFIPMVNSVLRKISDLTLCLDSKGADFSKVRRKRRIALTKTDKAFMSVTLLVLLFFILARAAGYGWISMME